MLANILGISHQSNQLPLYWGFLKYLVHVASPRILGVFASSNALILCHFSASFLICEHSCMEWIQVLKHMQGTEELTFPTFYYLWIIFPSIQSHQCQLSKLQQALYSIMLYRLWNAVTHPFCQALSSSPRSMMHQHAQMENLSGKLIFLETVSKTHYSGY